MIPKEAIEKSKHIVIKSSAENFPQASILYSYLLTQHKKVSLFGEFKEQKFSFLPWFEKLRPQAPSSADLQIDANIEILDLYRYFQATHKKINAKMATAFYAGFMQRYKNFVSSECDGTVFAVLSALIEQGAAYKECVKNMLASLPLSTMRLKGRMLSSFVLKENAKVACVSISSKDLQACGASMDDAIMLLDELLNIVHVEEVHLVQRDEKEKIIKIVKEV